MSILQTILYLVRHGQTEWNVEKRIQGRLDSPLTELGRQQAKKLAQRIKHLPLQQIYSSSSKRAIDTALYLKEDRKIDLRKTDQLMEISLGKWEGRKWSDIDIECPTELEIMTNHPERFKAKETAGETFFKAQERLVSFVNQVRKDHVGESILLVSHALAIKVLINYFRGGTMGDLWEGPDSHWASLYQLHFSSKDVQILFAKENICGYHKTIVSLIFPGASLLLGCRRATGLASLL